MLGTTEDDTLLISPMANVDNGTRLIPAIGNACQTTNWTCQIPIPEVYFYPQVIAPYYWGVQAIDHTYSASPFATENLIPITYLQVYNDRIISMSDSLAWDIIHGDSVDNYHIQIDDDSTFSSCEIDETLIFLKDTTSADLLYSVMLGDLIGSNNLVEGEKYYWRIKPNYTFGLPTAFTKPASSFWFGYVNAMEDDKGNAIPKEFSLQQNYPNPFNPVTQIKYALPKSTHVKIELYDVLGRKIIVLVDDQKPAGYYTLEFNAGHLASGVYIYRIQAGNFVRSKKMLLIK
jgi:hypothetical protein